MWIIVGGVPLVGSVRLVCLLATARIAVMLAVRQYDSSNNRLQCCR